MDSVKIGGIDYSIRNDCDEYLDGAKIMGEINLVTQTISIDSKLKKQRKEQVLVHEIVHGLLYEMGNEDWNNEEFVNPFSNILYQLLKDNKINFNE